MMWTIRMLMLSASMAALVLGCTPDESTEVPDHTHSAGDADCDAGQDAAEEIDSDAQPVDTEETSLMDSGSQPDDAGDTLTADTSSSGDTVDQDTSTSADTVEDDSEHRVIGYFTSWSVYGRDYHVPDIPADKLTHINYAFANISNSGECVLGDNYADIDKFYEGDTWDAGALRGNFKQLRKLKQQHPHLKTLISIGGWTWSSKFSDVALTPESREKFVTSCVDFMDEYGFDGIDVDWEYPVGGGKAGNTTRPEDRQNYTKLLAEFRRQLDEHGASDGRHYLLTIAAPAGPSKYDNYELGEIHQYLDWINIMAYDFHGSWSQKTNFNAPLYASSNDPSQDPEVRDHFNVDSAVQGYLDAGVPADEIVVGVPFYGRGWKGVSDANNGLFQAHSGVPQGTWERGVFDWEDIKDNYLPSHDRYWHDEAQVPWLYDPATQTMISYDDPESLGLKTEYVRDQGLGGVMFWELSADDPQDTLLEAIQ